MPGDSFGKEVSTTEKEETMNARSAVTFAGSFALACAVLAQESGGAKTMGVSKAKAPEPMVMPAADLKWSDLDPTGAPGVKIVDLWGNHAEGAFGAFLKLPAGFAVPLHRHTHAIKVVIVSGTYIQAPEGKPEFRIGPGSYFLQPGDNYWHTTSCDKSSECLFFAESNGAFDLIVKNAPAKK
jgi:anti-sigma factor ChrR (cupin superfamily)